MIARGPAVALACGLALATPASGRDDGADGRFDRRSSSHFVLYQDVDIDQRTGRSGSRSFEREVVRSLEAAYDAFRSLLDVEPRSPITVVVYDPGIFDREFGASLPFPAAGFFHGVIRVRGDVRVTAELERVLHHEYAHAAFQSAAPSVELPALLNEGIAEWFARRSAGAPAVGGREGAMLAAAAARGSLAPLGALVDANFAPLGPEGAPAAYAQATAFVSYLVQERGESGLRDLLRSLFRRAPVDAACERVYHRTLAELDADFRAGLAR